MTLLHISPNCTGPALFISTYPSSSSSFQWFCVPFILTSPFSANVTLAAVTKVYQEPWIGKVELEDAGRWIDELLLLVTDKQAQVL